MVPRLKKALRVPTPAYRGPGRPWHPIPRDKIFSEKISTRVRVRPEFEEALRTAREVKSHAPRCRVIFTVYEMKRLGRDAAGLTALADHLTAHGLVLEMLAGPLPGIYDPTGPGRLLFAFFAVASGEQSRRRRAGVAGLALPHAGAAQRPSAQREDRSRHRRSPACGVSIASTSSPGARR